MHSILRQIINNEAQLPFLILVPVYVIFRARFGLLGYFRACDAPQCTFVSETKFTSSTSFPFLNFTLRHLHHHQQLQIQVSKIDLFLIPISLFLKPIILTTMSPTHPSIQSFYKREVRMQNREAPEAVSPKPGDGFTEEELADALDPLNRKWNPEREFEELNISQLVPGPRAVTFCGRIVNLNTVHGRNQKQPKASGWHFLVVKDDSAAISVRFHPFFSLRLANDSPRSNCSLHENPILSSSVNFSPPGLPSFPTLLRQIQQLLAM